MTAMPNAQSWRQPPSWQEQLTTQPLPSAEQLAQQPVRQGDPLSTLLGQLEQHMPGLSDSVDNQAQHQAANQWLRQQTEETVNRFADTPGVRDNYVVQQVQQSWPALAAQAQQAFPRVDPTRLAQHYQENARVAVQQARLARQMNQPYTFFRNEQQPEGFANQAAGLVQRGQELLGMVSNPLRGVNAVLGPQGRDILNWTGRRALPFASGLFGINETGGAIEAASRIQSGEATPNDYRNLSDWQRRREAAAQHGLVRQAFELATQIPAFGVEIALTGGAYTAGQSLANRATQRIATRAAENAAGRIVLRHTAGSIGRGVGALAGVAGVTAANPARVGEEWTNIQAGRIRQNERGEFTIDPGTVLDVPRAFGHAYIEQLTERLGGNFGRIAAGAGRLTGTTPLMRSLSTRIAASGLANRWIQSGANRTLSGFTQAISNPTGRLAVAREFMQGLTSRMGLNRLARQTQFSGLFGEMMEERVGDVLKGFLDLSFQERPDFGAMGDAFDWIGSGFRNKRAGNAFLRQLAAEGMGFMAYGGAMRVAEGMRRGAGQAMRGDTQQPAPTPGMGMPVGQPTLSPNMQRPDRVGQFFPMDGQQPGDLGQGQQQQQRQGQRASAAQAQEAFDRGLETMRRYGVSEEGIAEYRRNYDILVKNGTPHDAFMYVRAEMDAMGPADSAAIGQSSPQLGQQAPGTQGVPVGPASLSPGPQRPGMLQLGYRQEQAAPPGMPVPASAPVQPAPTQQGSVQTPSWRATRYDVQTPVQTQAPADPGQPLQQPQPAPVQPPVAPTPAAPVQTQQAAPQVTAAPPMEQPPAPPPAPSPAPVPVQPAKRSLKDAARAGRAKKADELARRDPTIRQQLQEEISARREATGQAPAYTEATGPATPAQRAQLGSTVSFDPAIHEDLSENKVGPGEDVRVVVPAAPGQKAKVVSIFEDAVIESKSTQGRDEPAKVQTKRELAEHKEREMSPALKKAHDLVLAKEGKDAAERVLNLYDDYLQGGFNQNLQEGDTPVTGREVAEAYAEALASESDRGKSTMDLFGDPRQISKAQSDYRARFKTEKGRLTKSEGMEESLNIAAMIADLGKLDSVEMLDKGMGEVVKALRAAGYRHLFESGEVTDYVNPKGKEKPGLSLYQMAERLVEKAGFIIPEGMTPTDWLLGAIRSDVARRVSETSALAADAGKEMEELRQQLIKDRPRAVVEAREKALAKLNADRAARGKPALKLEAGEKAKAKPKRKADAAAVMNAVLDQATRIPDPAVTFDTIREATADLDALTIAQLKELAGKADMAIKAKRKADIVKEIQEKLINRKDDYERADFRNPANLGPVGRDSVDETVQRGLQDGEAAGQAEEFAEDAGFIGQAPKTVSAQQLVLDLSDLFGIKITVKKIPPTKDKQGNIVAQSRGRFGVATGEIIMDPMHVGSFSTLAHELGHWIATGLEVWPRSYQSLPADIQRGFISMDYKPNRGDPAKSAYEGFAEYIRYRLLGDLGRYTTADQKAAIAWANEEILKRKDLEKKLTQAEKYIYARTSLSAVDQNDLSVTGKAEMSNGMLTLGQRLRRLITEGWRWFYNVAYTGGIFDEIQPIIEKAMGKLTMGLKDLRLSISYQTPGFYDRMINKGVFAWMGSYYKTIGPSFAQMERHVQGTAFDKELLNGAREWEAFVMSKYILDEQAKRVALRATGKKGVQDVVGPETLAKYEAIYNNLVYDTELVRAAEKTHALYTQGFNAILKAKLAMGWISQADYNAMMAAHPNYLSLTRVMLGHEDDNVLQEQGQITNPLLPRTGSDAQIIAPSLAYAIEVQKFAVMMARAQANRPIFDAVRFREQRPGEDYARGAMLGSYIVETDAPIDVTTISREDILKALIKSGVNKQMAKLTVNAMKADELLFFRQAPWDESGKNIVVEMVDGVKKFYEVKDRYLYEELTGQAGASSGLVQAIRLIADFPLMQRYTKAVKFGAATTSIGFQFKNVLRDVETFIENSEKMSALASKDAVLAYARMYAWYGRMITGDGKANQQYLTKDGKGVILENIYMEAGGQNMRAVAYDPPAAVDRLRGKRSKLDRFKAAVETMGAAEQAPRLIEYTSSLRSQGYDEARIHKNLLAQPDVYPIPVDVQNNAILAAARVTSPHSNVGPLFKELNKINPFMGASMAGIANEMRNWKQNPWRAARALAIFTGLEMAYWWWNHKEPWFKELEPWQRNAYWYFQWGPGFLRIPRPRGTYGLLPALGQDQMRRMFDENPNFGGWFDQAVAEYSHPLIPEPGNTLWQIQGNQDWRGAPIVPPNVQRTGSTLEQRGYQARYALDRALGGIPTRGGQAIRAWRESESVLGGVGGGILSQIPLYHLGQPSASLTQLYARDREITQQALRATQNGQPAFQPNEEQHRIQQAAQAVAALNAYMAGRNTRHRLAQRDIYGNSSTAEQIVEGLPRMTATQRASLGELRLRLAQYGLQGGQPPDLSAIASPQMRQAMQQMLNRRQRGQSRPALRMG